MTFNSMSFRGEGVLCESQRVPSPCAAGVFRAAFPTLPARRERPGGPALPIVLCSQHSGPYPQARFAKLVMRRHNRGPDKA